MVEVNALKLFGFGIFFNVIVMVFNYVGKYGNNMFCIFFCFVFVSVVNVFIVDENVVFVRFRSASFFSCFVSVNNFGNNVGFIVVIFFVLIFFVIIL